MDCYKVISTGEGGITAVDGAELTTRMRLLSGLV
jgi:dTDP-4-amino-4,6-dideoxygalactose transaminase